MLKMSNSSELDKPIKHSLGEEEAAEQASVSRVWAVELAVESWKRAEAVSNSPA